MYLNPGEHNQRWDFQSFYADVFKLRSFDLSPLASIAPLYSELEFLNSLWGLGTELE